MLKQFFIELFMFSHPKKKNSMQPAGFLYPFFCPCLGSARLVFNFPCSSSTGNSKKELTYQQLLSFQRVRREVCKYLEAAALGSHREPGPLSPHSVAIHQSINFDPQGPGPRSFPYPPSSDLTPLRREPVQYSATPPAPPPPPCPIPLPR
jgi:hypothetical protein